MSNVSYSLNPITVAFYKVRQPHYGSLLQNCALLATLSNVSASLNPITVSFPEVRQPHYGNPLHNCAPPPTPTLPFNLAIAMLSLLHALHQAKSRAFLLWLPASRWRLQISCSPSLFVPTKIDGFLVPVDHCFLSTCNNIAFHNVSSIVYHLHALVRIQLYI